MSTQTTTPVGMFIAKTVLFAWVLLAVAVGVAFLFGKAGMIVSLIFGTAISSASFAVLSLVLVRAVKGGRGVVWFAVLGVFKMAILGVAIWFLLNKNIVEPITFMAGFSSVIASLIVVGLVTGKTHA
jgi:hypothetical protein